MVTRLNNMIVGDKTVNYLPQAIILVLMAISSSSANACELPGPPIEVVYDDTPPCVMVTIQFRQSLHVSNGCSHALSLLFQSQHGDDPSTEPVPLEIEVGQDVSLDVYGDAHHIVWRLTDGGTGRIETALGRYDGQGCPNPIFFGCDTTASRVDSTLMLLCLVFVFIGLRRYQHGA